MKIVHIITGLGDGGAEHTLYKICKYDKNNTHIVISLTGPGKYFFLLNKIGIKVHCLQINFFAFFEFYLLMKILNSLKPNIVQTWLVHADFIGGLAARFLGIRNIIWNIRYSNFELGKAKLSTILITKILTKLSYKIPNSIIIVSKKAKKIYLRKGYDPKKLKYIPNGYDLSILRINRSQNRAFKKNLKIKQSIPLIGNVARYDPKKDHLNLLKALSIIKSKKIDFLCILVGSNINFKNKTLTSQIKKLKLSSCVKLLGQKNDILTIMNALDIYVQSSKYGEGFPNVVAEAMACGTPCVVTDVGDASLIVGKTGWAVTPNNSVQLASNIEKAIFEYNTKNWNKKCKDARSRIYENFDISKMLSSYNKLWHEEHRNNYRKIYS